MVTRRLWLTFVLIVFLAACQSQAAPSTGSSGPEPTAKTPEPSTSAGEEGEPSPRSHARPTPSEEEGELEGCPSTVTHPQGTRLAERYDVPYDEIMEWFCNGFGFGEVNRAYSLSQKKSMSVEEVFALREDGLGWGQIKKQLGVKPGGGPPDD
jgi:hypothetical protein